MHFLLIALSRYRQVAFRKNCIDLSFHNSTTIYVHTYPMTLSQELLGLRINLIFKERLRGISYKPTSFTRYNPACGARLSYDLN